MTTRVGKLFWKFNKFITLPMALFYSFHFATQVNYTINKANNLLNPTETRKEFKEEFGINLHGFPEDIEGNPQKIGMLKQVLEREQFSKPLEITSITIESDNYLKKNFTDQMSNIISSGYMGYCLPDRIVIKSTAERNTFEHELKHARTFEVLREHPDFLDEWKSLSKDEDGKLAYMSIPREFCYRLRYLENLVDDDVSYEDKQKYGFVSDYAATSAIEDIAELCQTIQDYDIFGGPVDVMQLLDFDKKSRLKDKVSLAQKYGLIPEEFVDYLKITKLYRDALEFRDSFNSDLSDSIMTLADEFEKKNPRSEYLAQTRFAKGRALQAKLELERVFNDSDGIENPAKREDLVDAYKKVLTAPLKDAVTYGYALQQIRFIMLRFEDSSKIGRYNRYIVYCEASGLLTDIINQRGPNINEHNVNGFLRRHGEL